MTGAEFARAIAEGKVPIGTLFAETYDAFTWRFLITDIQRGEEDWRPLLIMRRLYRLGELQVGSIIDVSTYVYAHACSRISFKIISAPEPRDEPSVG